MADRLSDLLFGTCLVKILLTDSTNGSPTVCKARVSCAISTASNIWPIVRPVKAGMFSGRQSHRGNSQNPVAWVAFVEEMWRMSRLTTNPWDGELVTRAKRK